MIDHLVLPTATLNAARHRLRRLGFTVATDAHHPFGTGNACVFMADGIYLEPLSITNSVVYDEAIAAGNAFVKQDRDFRFLRGDEGLSAVALATDDAFADHRRFGDAGLSGGDILEFSRLARLADGSDRLARFRLAFAGNAGTDSPGVFVCQRLEPLPADRAALERHDNGVSRMVELVLASEGAAACASHLAVAFDMDLEVDASDRHVLSATNAVVRVLATADYEEEFGVAENRHGVSQYGVGASAIVFRVPDLAVTRAVLAANDVAFVNKGGRIVVAPAPGQGAVFAFEE